MANKIRMSKDEVRKANKNISNSNKKITEKSLEKISTIINKKFGKTPFPQELEETFYDNLEKIFKNTTDMLYHIYPKAKDYKVKDLFSITYDEDGKTTEERMRKYWKDGEQRLRNSSPIKIEKIRLLGLFKQLLENESAIVERVIKQEKVQPIAEYVCIEGGCACNSEKCNAYIGDWPADEDIPLPPYHPNCECSYFYYDDENEDLAGEENEIIIT